MNDSYVLKLRHTGSDSSGGGVGAMWQGGVSYTLSTHQDQTLFQPVDFRHGVVGASDDTVGTIQAKKTGGYSLNYSSGVTNGYVVRRLTPLECERLQGFPDGWTDLAGCDADEIVSRMPQLRDTDGSEAKAIERKVRKWCESTPDGFRYKAIGNSMATNVMRWLGSRLQLVDEILAEQDERH